MASSRCLVCVVALALVCGSLAAMSASPSSDASDAVHVIPDAPAFAVATAALDTVFNTNAVTAPSPCTYAASGGSWDLSPLFRTTGDYKGTDGTYDYKMNVCGPSNSGPGCTDKSFAICQFSQAGGTFVASLGSFAQPPTWSLITLPSNPAEPVANGVMYTFTNGDICWIAGRQQVRTVMTVFRCNPGSTEESLKVEEDQTTCTFTITLKTDKGCQGSGPGPTPPTPDKKESGGISGGTVFVIIFFSLIPIYIGLGCLYGRTKKQLTGIDAMPNIAFWRDLPGLVKDGAKYAWNMTRSGCKSGTGEAYEKL